MSFSSFFSTSQNNIATQETAGPVVVQITTSSTGTYYTGTPGPITDPALDAGAWPDTTGTGRWYPYTGTGTTHWMTFASTNNITSEEITHVEGVEIFLAVFFIVLTLATIVGNMMALTVFTRIPVTKTVSVIFFTSMAIADLCNGIFVMPFSVYSLLNEGRIITGLTINDTIYHYDQYKTLMGYCTFSGIVMNTSTKAALFTLILICFDRFISVHDALHVHLIMTVKNCSILVLTCWLAALMLALFPFLTPSEPYSRENRTGSWAYRYVPLTAQCTYRVEEAFNLYEVHHYRSKHTKIYPNGDVLVQSPYYVNIAYFFVNILPIIIPTYLIVFFCVAVIAILNRIFKNSKRIIQQIEPPDLKRNRSFRNSVHLTKELRSLSFKRKASEKPITTQMNKVDAGYTEIHVGQGTASEHLEGQVVLRRTSRKITQVNVNAARSPNLARDRWSQISVKSLQKRTKADHQKKAIDTVILMLMFFVFCYALEWFSILTAQFYYMGLVPNLWDHKDIYLNYIFILQTIMKYLNCAGNPFLYYFRMSQFQKEVRGLTQSFNGTPNNRIQTSGSRSYRSKNGYVSLVGKSSSSARNKSSCSYKYRASVSRSPPR